MESSKKYFIGIELILGGAVLILAFLMLGERNRDALGKVSVIVSDSDNAQWAAFRYGLRMAAEDRGIEVVILGTESILTLEEEEILIRNEIANGADAVIVQPVPGEGAAEMLRSIQKKVPVMLIGRPASGEEGPELPAAGPDEYGLGASLGEQILKDYSGRPEGKTVGILSRTTDSEVTARRSEGFQDALRGSGMEVEWHVAGNFDGGGGDYLKNQPKVDIVAALDDYSLTSAGECSAKGGLQGALVYGVGHSTEAAYYLDSGAVECLAVPDEFNVGYQSMSELADCLESFFHRAQSQEVDHTLMRRETLFSKENQEILFTMSQ